MTIYRRFLAAALFLSGPAVAGEPESFANPEADEQRTPSLDQLPAGLKKHIGKGISLIADFENKAGNGVPLFLVNGGDQKVEIPSQDGAFFIKLEFLNVHGRWQLAQSHYGSFCGNSYYSVPLEKGRFFKLAGYHPAKGKKAKIRWRNH